MDAVKFLKEYTRMCDGYNCSKCPVEQELAEGRSCVSLEATNPEELVAIVERWSKEHPWVTNGQKFTEVLPEYADVKIFDNTVDITFMRRWWDAEYEGE